jgi:hypothetical protein
MNSEKKTPYANQVQLINPKKVRVVGKTKQWVELTIELKTLVHVNYLKAILKNLEEEQQKAS